MNAASPERWIRLWRQVSDQGAPVPAYQELVARYREPHRHYHNLIHVAECLAELDSAAHLAQQAVAVEFAIWFHDLIYDSHAQDNEEKSAQFARQLLSKAGGPPALGEQVAALIMATKRHDPSLHPDAKVLVDLDLSILGQPEVRFHQYEAQIRKEYEWVPEMIFAARRAEILEGFLARDRIFNTDHFFAKYEQPARTNLLNSVRQLRASSSQG